MWMAPYFSFFPMVKCKKLRSRMFLSLLLWKVLNHILYFCLHLTRNTTNKIYKMGALNQVIGHPAGHQNVTGNVNWLLQDMVRLYFRTSLLNIV